jgi:NADPH:quinone reductase-like Zn-dependent oxidoreductase
LIKRCPIGPQNGKHDNSYFLYEFISGNPSIPKGMRFSLKDKAKSAVVKGYEMRNGLSTNGMMTALRLHSFGDIPTLDRIPIPAIKSGETLVKVEAAAIGHLDLTIMSGNFNIRPSLPYVGGTDGAGIVIKSDRFRKGDRVALRGGGLGMLRSGTWAEYVAVRDEAVREVPAQLPAELAATIYSPLTTSQITLHDIARLGNWQFGPRSPAEEIVIVTGASGAVGSVVVQLAMRAGAHVIAIVSKDANVALVPPATEVISLSNTRRIEELAKSCSATLLVDTVAGERLAERISWIKTGGRAALLGYTAGKQLLLDLPNWFLSSVALLPVSMLFHETKAKQVIDALTTLVTDGAIRLPVERYCFGDAHLGFERLANGLNHGKVVIAP